jgi:hypothetical protein
MIVFAILSPTVSNPALEAAITTNFPNDWLKIGPGQWLTAGRGTAVDVSNLLGISDGKNGVAIIFSIASYFGRADTNVWEWIRVKLSTP